MSDGIAVYGLRQGAFETRTLDVVNSELDQRLACQVDGWSSVPDVETYLMDRYQSGEPALVVVSGDSGTGRRSMKNQVLALWAGVCGVAPSRIIACEWQVRDYQAEDQFYEWSHSFNIQARKLRARLQPATQNAFQALITSRPPALSAAIQQAVSFLAEDLEGQFALAGVLEGVNNRELLRLSSASFQAIRMLVVLVVEDTDEVRREVLDQIQLMVPRAFRVRLSRLRGQDVAAVVERRWELYSDQPIPFPNDEITVTFSDRGRTLAHVLQLVESLLLVKVAGSPPVGPGVNGPGFAPGEARNLVAVLERSGGRA